MLPEMKVEMSKEKRQVSTHFFGKLKSPLSAEAAQMFKSLPWIQEI